MLIYLLKANIVLTLFCLAYYFGLRRLTFYTLNRVFLLAGIGCAALCPFIDANMFIQQHEPLQAVAVTYVPDLKALGQKPAMSLLERAVIWIFWSGVIVMGVRLLIQLLSLWKFHRSTTGAVAGEEHVRLTDKQVNPFSFLRNIYINPSLHTPVELTAILRHEQIHVRQWHSLDVLLGDLNKVFYWFNPGAWFMSMAIRENLEFITDRQVLRQGIDAKTYQYSLIKVSGIPYATAIANNFNFSHLKQRIMMMNKKRSSRYNLLRYLGLGSVMGLAALSLNFTRPVEQAKELIAATVQNRQDTVPAPPPVPPVRKVKAPVAPTAPAPPPAPATSVHGTPVPAPTPATSIQGKPVPATAPLPATHTIPAPPLPPPPGKAFTFMSVRDKGQTQPVIFVDNQKVNSLDGIDTNKIRTVEVFYGDEAVKRAGKEGENGLVFVTTSNGTTHGAKNIVSVSPDSKNPVKAITFSPADGTGEEPMYLLDGKPISKEEFKALNPDNIDRVNVYKGESATQLYGSRAAGGAVEIWSKPKK
jgi:hypothetical protein